MNTVYEKGQYRIIERNDDDYTMSDLKGDCFKPEMNPETEKIIVQLRERDFEDKVESEGVYGYELEKWNGEVGQGWESIDSCWGFIGTHEAEKHYIVKEFIDQINKGV